MHSRKTDILSSSFKLNLEKIQTKEMISDLLLDQNIFAGCGNIIKNETLWTHPETSVFNLSNEKMFELSKCVVQIAKNWLKHSTQYQYKIYRKKFCAKQKQKQNGLGKILKELRFGVLSVKNIEIKKSRMCKLYSKESTLNSLSNSLSNSSSVS